VRFSATTLEAFRYFLTAGDRADEAALLATIEGRTVTTPRMRFGRAYDAILEAPETYRVADGYACDGYRFEADTIDPVLATLDRAGLFQAKATKQYGAHTVVAKVDHVLGGHVTEIKTRIGSYRPDRYARSAQWRFECDVFAADVVTYRVCRLSQDPYALEAIEDLPLWRYPALEADCTRLVEVFAGYITRRGLEAFVVEREEFAPRPAMTGPAFEDAPTRPSSSTRLRALRAQVRDRRAAELDEALPYASIDPWPALQPIAELPTPTFTLRPSASPRRRQALLF
jgi:hypothetical protein